jgi:hypothetical protein
MIKLVDKIDEKIIDLKLDLVNLYLNSSGIGDSKMSEKIKNLEFLRNRILKIEKINIRYEN